MNASLERCPALRHLPNAITIARLLSTPALAWLAWRGIEDAFAALLIAALASDLIDGWLARRLRLESANGALLDSVADLALMSVVLFAIWPLHPAVYRDHGGPMAAVVALIALGHVIAVFRFGRLASFHTRLLRAGIVAFSGFALLLFTVGFQPWLLYAAIVVCAAGALEQLALVLLLPEWSPNFRGGIAAAMQKRAQGRR